MNILYYYWNENTAYDCINCMKELGHRVDVFDAKFKNYTQDDNFYDSLMTVIKNYDCVFSFNYFPIISDVALDAGVKYISWVYDSPNLTLEANNLTNSCNQVFLFDYALCMKYRNLGIDTVDYMPLAYNKDRINKLTEGLTKDCIHDISFIGSLYDGKDNFFTSVKYLPEFLSGYIDALIATQRKVYGYDLIGKAFDDEKCMELSKYVSAKLGSSYRDCEFDIYKDMIRKKLTGIERKEIVKKLAMEFPVALYSGKKPDDIPVLFCGYAENRIQMPTVFYQSKINLNITLRSIQSGIPLRVVEILGAGGFCLTNYQSEMPEYFENGKHLVWYENEDDIIDKCRYYLDSKHETERKEIAKSGSELAAELFDYKVLLPKVLQL